MPAGEQPQQLCVSLLQASVLWFLRVNSFRQVSPCASQAVAHPPALQMSESFPLENKKSLPASQPTKDQATCKRQSHPSQGPGIPAFWVVAHLARAPLCAAKPGSRTVHAVFLWKRHRCPLTAWRLPGPSLNVAREEPSERKPRTLSLDCSQDSLLS